MARIPDDELEHIKRDVPLTDLCGRYGIELQPQGKDFIGHCPFHDDKTPSFIVTPSKNLWNCLGACGCGGDNIQFIIKKEGISFRHAVEKLQQLVGTGNVTLHPVTPTITTRSGKEYPALVDPAQNFDDVQMLAKVVDFYHESFLNQAAAMQYLQRRNCFHPEAVKLFKIGYANRTLGYRVPPQETVAGKTMRTQLQRIGIYRESGHEHLSGCVVFPVINAIGEITEIYGRKINDNLRQGTAYHLYLPGPHGGVWNSAGLLPKNDGTGEWLLCEAILDALSFWCHGYRHVTASYGTNGFTPDHWKLLRQVRPGRVVICYDNDTAGNKAANELAQQLEPEGIEAWRVELAPGSDINDLVRASDDPQNALAQVLATATRLLPLETVHAPAPIAVQSPLETPTAHEAVYYNILPSTGTIEGGQADFALEGRHWRIRGLDKNNTFDALKVTVRLEHSGKYHFDTFDLYNARNRGAFLLTAASATSAEAAALEADLSGIIAQLEEYQDKRLIKKMAATDLPQIALTAEDEREALTVLKSPRLLERVLADAHKCGLVGEDTNILTAWLVTLSRKLDKPLGVCVMSRSAAGKSSLLEAVSRFVPEEDRHQYTALTPQALFHMPENELMNKALFIAEDIGADGASYSLKTIQSDGQLVMACTMKDEESGQMVTKTKVVKGPIALFLTSTSRSIDDELLNRLLVLTVDESPEQTRHIHEAQRHAQTLEGIIERRSRSRLNRLQQNLQRLIRPLMVRNPFARELTFGNGQLRSRRDHQKYLDLINVMALVHQYQREIKSAVDGEGQTFQYIEVGRDDIERVDSLMRDILQQTADEISPQSRRMLTALRELEARQRVGNMRPKFTRRQIREATGWSDTQVRMVLTQLVELEHVWQFGGGQGRRALYQLAEENTGYEGQTSHFAGTSQSLKCEVVTRASSSLLAAKKNGNGTSHTSHRVHA
jgi:DNA primase catalytic core